MSSSGWSGCTIECYSFYFVWLLLMVLKKLNQILKIEFQKFHTNIIWIYFRCFILICAKKKKKYTNNYVIHVVHEIFQLIMVIKMVSVLALPLLCRSYLEYLRKSIQFKSILFSYFNIQLFFKKKKKNSVMWKNREEEGQRVTKKKKSKEKNVNWEFENILKTEN